MNQDVESGCAGNYSDLQCIIEHLVSEGYGVRGRISYQSIEEIVEGDQIGEDAISAHLVEDRGGEVWPARVDIGSNGGIEQGLGRPRDNAARV